MRKRRKRNRPSLSYLCVGLVGARVDPVVVGIAVGVEARGIEGEEVQGRAPFVDPGRGLFPDAAA